MNCMTSCDNSNKLFSSFSKLFIHPFAYSEIFINQIVLFNDFFEYLLSSFKFKKYEKNIIFENKNKIYFKNKTNCFENRFKKDVW